MSSVTATAAPEAALHPALRDFYAEDARRAHSAERDLGLRWRSVDGSTYRAAWVEDTGELYSVRHGSPEDGHRVTVLARLSADALERELAGARFATASGLAPTSGCGSARQRQRPASGRLNAKGGGHERHRS